MKSFFYSRDVLVKKSTLELTSTSAPAILICANAAHDQVDIDNDNLLYRNLNTI